MQFHEQWLHIQANESSWPRTHTPWQRCTPHPSAATKTDDLWCPFQSITRWAWEGQSVTNPKVETNSVTILRSSRIFTRFKVIFCKWGERRTEKMIEVTFKVYSHTLQTGYSQSLAIHLKTDYICNYGNMQVTHNFSSFVLVTITVDNIIISYKI